MVVVLAADGVCERLERLELDEGPECGTRVKLSSFGLLAARLECSIFIYISMQPPSVASVACLVLSALLLLLQQRAGGGLSHMRKGFDQDQFLSACLHPMGGGLVRKGRMDC
jgi:hypothetical protein